MTHCRSLLIADVSRAFFEAPAKRDLCVELPEEALAAGETTFDTVGKLKASLYGTRDGLNELAGRGGKVHGKVGVQSRKI